MRLQFPAHQNVVWAEGMTVLLEYIDHEQQNLKAFFPGCEYVSSYK